MISIDRIPLEQAALQRGNSASLNGGQSSSRWDRWSYIPGPASHILQCDARTKITTLRSAQTEEQRWPDPLAALAWLGNQATEPPIPGPPFKGGWVGNLSYDLGRLFENLPSRAADDLQLPLFTFTHHDQVIAIDHDKNIAYDCRLSAKIPVAWASRPCILPPHSTDNHLIPPSRVESSPTFSNDPPQADFTRTAYESAVQRAIDYISAGDIFQVNLAQRFTAGLPKSPGQLYRDLHRRYPAWFGAYLDYGDHALLCNSPELFLRITPQRNHRNILTRPIKGTRPRGPGLDTELRESLKDQAELNMIIDLERNDLGRICRIGTVKVTERRLIETHPTLFHGAATIEGVLRDEVTFVNILRATFPGGSVTGAPKIRAMEIIEELEPVRRGPYCGAIGYLSADGHVQFNVAIRTMIARSNRVYFSVGGGIVADSQPTAEYDETIVKAKAMFDVLGPKSQI